MRPAFSHKAYADDQTLFQYLKRRTIEPPAGQFLKTVCKSYLPAAYLFERNPFADGPF